MKMPKQTWQRVWQVLAVFRTPLLMVGSLLAYGALRFFLHVFLPQQEMLADGLLLLAIFVGSFDLLRETFRSLVAGHFALDYIALLAIATAVVSHQYVVATVIALMLSGGNALEYYGRALATGSLTALADRIPHHVQLLGVKDELTTTSIALVKPGQEILVRKGEVVPLDGELLSKEAVIDEASLTGEPFPMEKLLGDFLRSGVVNIGDALTLRVTKADKDSTYRKILRMVEKAQAEKSPLIRLADQYSGIFTLVTLALCALAYAMSHDVARVLAVLVVATPCPLILATPIALMGGMNAAAKKRIVIKHLASIEVLSRVDALIFDKTGTITFGKPKLEKIKVLDRKYDAKKVVGIASGLERSSIHPFAKTMVAYAHAHQLPMLKMTHVKEEIGKGISGVYDGVTYQLFQSSDQETMVVGLRKSGTKTPIAFFHFVDEMKKDSVEVLRALRARNLTLSIFTGDQEKRAQQLVDAIGLPIALRANCTPEQKRDGIQALRKSGHITAMVGDGINDAPALALSDVGIAFSNEEHTATSEAADIVLLGHDLGLVDDAISIAQHTLAVAKQSIFVGIGLSMIGMLFAAFGYIPPVVGAGLQEVIDVSVILNALRATSTKG
jgi:heavy metal translocating P-type ATPase